MHHDEASVLALEVDAHVPGRLGRCRGHHEVHGPVVAKLALLVGKVNLDPREDLDAKMLYLVCNEAPL